MPAREDSILESACRGMSEPMAYYSHRNVERRTVWRHESKGNDRLRLQFSALYTDAILSGIAIRSCVGAETAVAAQPSDRFCFMNVCCIGRSHTTGPSWNKVLTDWTHINSSLGQAGLPWTPRCALASGSICLIREPCVRCVRTMSLVLNRCARTDAYHDTQLYV